MKDFELTKQNKLSKMIECQNFDMKISKPSIKIFDTEVSIILFVFLMFSFFSIFN